MICSWHCVLGGALVGIGGLGVIAGLSMFIYVIIHWHDLR